MSRQNVGNQHGGVKFKEDKQPAMLPYTTKNPRSLALRNQSSASAIHPVFRDVQHYHTYNIYTYHLPLGQLDKDETRSDKSLLRNDTSHIKHNREPRKSKTSGLIEHYTLSMKKTVNLVEGKRAQNSNEYMLVTRSIEFCTGCTCRSRSSARRPILAAPAWKTPPYGDISGMLPAWEQAWKSGRGGDRK